MSQGGNLTRGAAWELELRFECRLGGLDLLTVRLPLLPHGSINFVLRKACTGPDRRTTRRLAALQIGMTPRSADVVLDGQPQPGYQVERTAEELWLEPGDVEATTLYMELDGEGDSHQEDGEPQLKRILAYEPLISVSPTKMLDLWATHDFQCVFSPSDRMRRC